MSGGEVNLWREKERRIRERKWRRDQSERGGSIDKGGGLLIGQAWSGFRRGAFLLWGRGRERLRDEEAGGLDIGVSGYVIFKVEAATRLKVREV